tara:strand:+ start:371 stop:856 length:486 start_codon:yes stop_codon:yes gene_type:complete
MFSKYNYNENLKRFEPKEKRCGFCFVKESENVENYHFIKLYKENSRTNFIIYRNLKYQEILIGVARCNDCAKFHDEYTSESPLIKYLIYLLLLIFVLPIFGLKFFVIGISFSLLIFFLHHKYSPKKTNKIKERYTLKEGADLNETIQDLIISGWTFNRPSA